MNKAIGTLALAVALLLAGCAGLGQKLDSFICINVKPEGPRLGFHPLGILLV